MAVRGGRGKARGLDKKAPAVPVEREPIVITQPGEPAPEPEVAEAPATNDSEVDTES